MGIHEIETMSDLATISQVDHMMGLFMKHMTTVEGIGTMENNIGNHVSARTAV